ncbi:ATP-dependent DNA helicase UvrD2 [Nocardioides limicola]|uniref:ATP-dependent DNA helicase UvrD2 n=1 Tax=Nocardioides limicola TaxID=2803368 RepID=UPI00193B443D|nr:ATP-dependent DNA helicase UvrD2 [Nocardioides sp. DJM-14]
MDAERLLASLDPEQRRVAEALRGPVRVLAGAGTGKTRAITHRIAHGVATGVYEPSEVLAVTFTTRAAGEMRERLRTLGAPGVQARTFHSAALRQLRYFWPRVHGRELPELTESKIRLLALAASRQRLKADQSLLRDLASEVEWAKVSNVRPEDYARTAAARGRDVAEVDHETVARVFHGYEDAKRSAGQMDMEDVLLLCAGLLATDEAAAAQVRRQYKWFVVDEFQDASPLQSALLDLWLGGRDEICVVGDPAQTIYSFAGADASYLRDFATKHPGATSIELVRNYRSTPQVIAVANALLANTPSQGVELQAQAEPAAAVRWVEFPDEVAEAEGVAARIDELRRAGVALGEIAVLFRINARSEAFEEALAARGIGYVVRGAARFFERAEVKQAVSLLRGAAHADPSARDVAAVLSQMNWRAEPPEGRGQVRDRWESLKALVDSAGDYFAAEGATLAGFVAELDRRSAEQHAPVADGVTLGTLHAAKGLEWDAVFVTGVTEGTLPFVYAETPAEIEEERRLLYVGVTRARRHLELSWALARNPGGRQSRKPSRFLDMVRPQAGDAAPGRRKAKARGKAARCRNCGRPLENAAERKTKRCGNCPINYNLDLFEALRSWRKERATAEGNPAYVVFTDATLEMIAERLPATHGELLKISGVGQSKLDKYGDEVLALVGETWGAG